MRSLKINFYKYMLMLLIGLFSLQLNAQENVSDSLAKVNESSRNYESNISETQEMNHDVEMADTLRENGKIYVVVVCLLLIFAGILTYLIILNRKVNKLEKMIRN